MPPLRFAMAGVAGSIALVLALAGATVGAGTASVVIAARAAPPVIQISAGVHYVTGAHAAPPTTAYCEAQYDIACYLPQQIERAYNLPSLYAKGITGKGQTIVIVDSFGSPTVAHDLAVFDQAAGLPAPPSLRVIQPAGAVAPYKPTDDR